MKVSSKTGHFRKNTLHLNKIEKFNLQIIAHDLKAKNAILGPQPIIIGEKVSLSENLEIGSMRLWLLKDAQLHLLLFNQ